MSVHPDDEEREDVPDFGEGSGSDLGDGFRGAYVASTLGDGSSTVGRDVDGFDTEDGRPFVTVDLFPGERRFGPGPTTGGGGGHGGGAAVPDPPEEEEPAPPADPIDPPDYNAVGSENKYLLGDEEVDIEDVLDNEAYLLFGDDADADAALLADGGAGGTGVLKFYLIYGLLVDMDISEDTPKYVFRLYPSANDLEIEIGNFLSTPPEQYSGVNGLFQDMSLFGNDLIVAARFERRINQNGFESYDQEYLMYEKTPKQPDNAATATHGAGFFLSTSSRRLFNYRFNVTPQGAQTILSSSISSIRDDFKIPRTQDLQYDFKFCETQRPEISGEQVITVVGGTTPTATTSTETAAATTTSGGGSSGASYSGGY